MLMHLATGGGNLQKIEPFTKVMLILLAAGGENQNCKPFTKEMPIHLAAGGENLLNLELSAGGGRFSEFM